MIRFNKIRTFIFSILLLLAGVANAQDEALKKYEDAVMFYQKNITDSVRAKTDVAFRKNNLDNSKANIDAAFAFPEIANYVEAWLLRGYIYKEFYFLYEKGNNNSPARIEALNSLKNALALDTEKESFTEIINGIKPLAFSFRNDVAESLNPFDYKTSIKLFGEYLKYYRIVDPSPDFIQSEKNTFDLALGSMYSDVLIKPDIDSGTTSKFFFLAKTIYGRVLASDPNNAQANYGMGRLYYNRAVSIITSLDIDIDMALLPKFEEQSLNYGQEGEPYMKTAYELDPQKEEAVLGLAGIYFILKDFEKSEKFRLDWAKLKGFKVGDRVKWNDSSITKSGKISGISGSDEFKVLEDGKEKSISVKISDLTKLDE